MRGGGRAPVDALRRTPDRQQSIMAKSSKGCRETGRLDALGASEGIFGENCGRIQHLPQEAKTRARDRGSPFRLKRFY